MANVIKKATNKFTKGLVMDFSPENTKSEVLTNALNATLLTFNGNELSLQNDMGNARVESAFLPEGYIPVGTCEYGGIIYIVSYNPLEDKSLIGCFPSPERNISRDELGLSNVTLSSDLFLEFKDGSPTGNLKNVFSKVLLKDSYINPGDKFIVYADESIYQEKLQDLSAKSTNGVFNQVAHPMIKLSVVSIQDNGKIVYLNSDVRLYENGNYKYHILGQTRDSQNNTIDVDSYRNVLSSGYNVFKEKSSGKLAILAELITIDSFSITHSIKPEGVIYTKKITVVDPDGNTTEKNEEFLNFNIYLHPEVFPEVNTENYLNVPKLKYYYSNKESLAFLKNGVDGIEYVDLQTDAFSYNLHDCINTTNEDINNRLQGISLNDVGLPFANKNYHGLVQKIKLEKNCYYNIPGVYLLKLPPILNVFRFSENNGIYTITSNVNGIPINERVLICPTETIIHDMLDFCVNQELLIIPVDVKIGDVVIQKHPIDSFTETYLPNQNGLYEDVLYQTIKFPTLLTNNKINLPFKYNYTITPCMEYGKLDYLSVSNTIDFNNLFNFEASNFNTWKYRIDDNQLTLTFGAEIFDTFSDKKVTGLVLEFYDWRGFAGSLEITNKKSYSGIFTKTIYLNTPQAVSTNKVNDTKDGYITGPTRNINIVKEGNIYKLNEKEVILDYSTKAWKYNNEDSLGDNNDCGILYSNVIYGVKAYFIISDGSGYDNFENKDEFFLFTFPIYNEYYYKLLNYKYLKNPELKLILTYKLEDSSAIIPYNNDDGNVKYDNGYSLLEDKDIRDAYLLGNFQGTSLELLRYFLVDGTTNLNLQVGLMKEYELFNLSCDQSINTNFKCNIELKGNSGVFDTSENSLLNNSFLKLSAGKKDEESVQEISNLSFHNFIGTINDSESIQIKYNFIVGYDININNISDKNIPMTTVCALYHKQGNSYNESDFGIRKELNGNGNDVYLPDYIFYNCGSESTYMFGVARMIDMHGKTIGMLCTPYKNYSEDAFVETTPTKLNSGTPLKNMLSDMGKYAFCQPHVHYMYSQFKSNIAKSDNGDLFLSNTIPNKDILNLNPCYNLSLNTLNSVLYQSEFISTLKVGMDDSNRKKYIGHTASKVCKFSRCLLNTMKSVYAYNPDYDTIQVRVGNISVKNDAISITSNIICTHSEMDTSESFNHYIKVGNVSFENYLEDLNKYSGIVVKNGNNWISAIDFIPDYTYCGSELNPYLISLLLYNILTPNLIYEDMLLDNGNKIAIRHHDETYSYIEGNLNRNTLYLWWDDKLKLIQLDVSNYEIDWDGELNMTSQPQVQANKNINIPQGPEFTESVLERTIETTEGMLVKFIMTLDKLGTAFMLSNSSLYRTTVESHQALLDPSVPIENKSIAISINVRLLKLISDTTTEEFTIINCPLTANIEITYNDNTKNYDSKYTTTGSINIGTDPYFKDSYITGYKITLEFPKQITYIGYKTINYDSISENIIHISKILDYGYYNQSSGGYDVSYSKTCLVGSLITLNDLVYYPEKDDHRLFMKNGCFSIQNNNSFKIYYRETETNNITNKDKNSLYFCYGPSFTGLKIENNDPENKL